jgi:hypothetical protein
MGTIKFGGGVVDIRGSIGGTVYSRNANGAYARNRTKPYNPNTASQQDARNTFGSIARTWKTLTEAQQKSFIDQTAAYPYVNRLGESSTLTGFQLFQKVNAQLSLLGQPIISFMIAPVPLPSTSFLQILTLVKSPAAFTFNAQFAGVAEVPADTVLVVEATRPLSNGTYRPKRQDFKQLLVIEAGTNVAAESISSAYANVYGAIGDVGNFIYIRLFLVSLLTGQTTNPQETSKVIS